MKKDKRQAQEDSKRREDSKKKEEPKRKANSSKSKEGLANNQTVQWVKANWKLTLAIVFGCLLVFGMRIMEESSWEEDRQKTVDENLYELLGVSPSATQKDIKKQFNKLIMEYHPDQNPECTFCPAKYEKISHAFEVLSNEDARAHYDQTNGVIEPLKSITKSLTEKNFAYLVEDSGRPWIIQVYSESSGQSQSFSRFWEEYAAEFDFIRFGRIHFTGQKSLVNRLPFGVLELPLIFSSIPSQDYELFEYDSDKSPNAFFKQFLRASFAGNYRNITAADLKALTESKDEGTKIAYIGVDSIPISFLYYSTHFKKNFDFAMTFSDEYAKVRALFDKPRLSFVVKSPLEVGTRVFSNDVNSQTLRNVLNYAKFTQIPKLKRASFEDFCLDRARPDVDDNANPSLCFIAIEESPSIQEVLALFAKKQNELDEKVFTGLSEGKPDFSEGIHRVQFARLSLGSNSGFASHVFSHVKKDNVKYMVFASGANLIGAFNNLNDFDIDFEDLIGKDFEQLHPLNNYIDTDVPLEFLLTNENFSYFYCLYSEIKKSWVRLLFVASLIFYGMNRLTNDHLKAGASLAIVTLLYFLVVLYTRRKADMPY